MKTKKEIRDWLLENAVDEEGNLDLSGLDFSDFDGNVFTSYMNVKGTLCQDNQRVKVNLYQDNQHVDGTLSQDNQMVGGDLYQDNQ